MCCRLFKPRVREALTVCANNDTVDANSVVAHNACCIVANTASTVQILIPELTAKHVLAIRVMDADFVGQDDTLGANNLS